MPYHSTHHRYVISGSGLKIHRLLGICGFVLVCGFASAQDKKASQGEERSPDAAFVSKTARLTAKPGDKKIDVVWDYQNRLDSPLIVERIDESCGCLHGKLEQQEVKPGDTGHIRAVFSPDQNRGVLKKSLHVRFVGHEKPVELVAEVSIPSPVDLSATELSWTQGQPAAAQTIEVKSGTGASFAINELLGVSPELFTIAKETITEGLAYRLSITPVGSATPGTHILQVRTNSPDPRDQVLAVFLHIRASDSRPSQAAITP